MSALIRDHVLPDGQVGRGVLGVMAWNMMGSGAQAIGPLLTWHVSWLERDPKAAVAAWRKACDELLEANPREVVEQAWQALWAEWMRRDPVAAAKHWNANYL